MPFASSFMAATVVLSRMEAKLFSSRLCRGSTRSRSAPGSSPGSISTTETFEPSAAYTVPSSRPMYPPPTTSSVPGISLKSRAEVESITARAVEFEAGNNRRTRASREDDAIEGQGLFAAAGLRDPQRIRILKRGLAPECIRPCAASKAAQAAGQFLDHALFPRPQAGQIDLGLGVLDAPVLGVARLVDQLGHVQQGFRRNAAAIEANAAGIRFRIDQRDLHAEIGGEKCGGVATRAAAHHCNVQV